MHLKINVSESSVHAGSHCGASSLPGQTPAIARQPLAQPPHAGPTVTSGPPPRQQGVPCQSPPSARVQPPRTASNAWLRDPGAPADVWSHSWCLEHKLADSIKGLLAAGYTVKCMWCIGGWDPRVGNWLGALAKASSVDGVRKSLDGSAQGPAGSLAAQPIQKAIVDLNLNRLVHQPQHGLLGRRRASNRCLHMEGGAWARPPEGSRL